MKRNTAILRKMIDSDIHDVKTLYRRMYEEQKTFGMILDFNSAEIEEMLRVQLKSKLFLQYVSETGEGIQGFGIGAMMRFPKKYSLPETSSPFLGFIHDVYVTPSLRRGGTAKALIEALEADFAEQGIGYVELHVLSHNDSGKHFWESNGYQDSVQVMYKYL